MVADRNLLAVFAVFVGCIKYICCKLCYRIFAFAGVVDTSICFQLVHPVGPKSGGWLTCRTVD